MSRTETKTEREYVVSGMTCSHCVSSVREAVTEVTGVDSVAVDLSSGRLTVAGAGFRDEAVASAVADAGYEVVS